jgi:PST family polysaccharide transporter
VRAHLAYGGMNAISALASVIGDRVDAMIIGGRFSAAAFGTYGLFTRIITALSTPIQRLKTSIEFPTYARIISERPRLRRAFEKALGLSLLLVLPVFLGIASVADLALSVGLGPQWVGYAPVLAIMCVYGAVRVASSCSTPLFMAAGLVRRALYLVFARLALMPVVILGAIATSPTLVSVALAATAAQVVVLVANYLLFVRPVLGACAGALAVTALRPLSAALLMLGAVALVRGQLEAAPDALALAAAVATGALVYCAGNLLLNRGVVRECLYIVRPLLETMFGANRGGREAGDPDAPAPAPAAKLADQR